MVEADNSAALKFNKHLGFEHESVMPKGGADGQDMVFLVMWPNSCSWLRV
jgi:hypothetical protein